MEVYPLDSMYRRIAVIDQFVSLLWVDRFDEFGDFKLVVQSTREMRSLLRVGTRLACTESYSVMVVEKFEDKVASDGQRLLTVEGRSLENIMDDRVAMGSLDDLTTTPKWTITDAPADVARKIFHDICVVGTLDSKDIIPFVIEGTFMPDDTIAEPSDDITVELEPTTVYTAIKEIAQVYGFGFRLLRHFDTSQLYFDIYMGSDRTSGQTLLPAVIFSSGLDNLQNVTELFTIDKAKNVAYVYSPADTAVVYPADVDPDIEGFERRVLVVNASDITSDNPDVAGALIQRGREELAKARASQAFDGEISQNSQFKAGRDYNLGDIVEMRDDDGANNRMRVTEIIYVEDSEGQRAYPTLSLNLFVNVGSWFAMGTTEWADMTTEEWDDMP